jgi:type IV pilus assembly protein PilB
MPGVARESVMSSHPDADAFVRNYLRRPTDATTRLVFADWLEETGTPSNVAWAHYVRAKVEAARHPFGGPDWRAAERDAAGHVPGIRARLTMSAARFVAWPKALLELLPGPNITVRLAGFVPTPAALEWVRRPLAVAYGALPLDRQEGALLIALPGARSGDLVAADFESLFGIPVVWVVGSPAEIRSAIRTHCRPDPTIQIRTRRGRTGGLFGRLSG